VEDQQSRSGTFVNDVQIKGPVLLNDGDTIQVAAVKLVYRCGTAANGH
jgi:pSer/pThr/pTyr-binding forkhead associated (FHA) protein